jgi:apolipoprotein N-acyltransferase
MHRLTKIFLALSTGVLLSFGWISIGPGLILLFALLPLFFLENHLFKFRDKKRSYTVIPYFLLSFFVFNTLSIWWIWNAAAIGAIAAILINTSLMTFVFYLFHQLRRQFDDKTAFIGLVFLWIGFEYFHTRWELNFPWLNLGNGLAKNISFIQWYEYTGITGGTLWILLSNILLYKTVQRYLKFQTFHASLMHLITWLLIILIPSWISLHRYHHYEETGETKNFTLLQPNIDPYSEKFGGMTNQDQMQRMLELAKAHTGQQVDFIIGPETAIQETLNLSEPEKNKSLAMINDFIDFHPESEWLIGAMARSFYEIGKDSIPPSARKLRNAEVYYDNFNTAVFLSPEGEMETYHKSQLVVGVEKMPFPKTMKFLDRLILNMGGTTGTLGMDKVRKVFTSSKDGIKLAPIICYESIYGEYVNEYIRNGANYLIVITNDGWWGDTGGYKQHWRFSQLRAIETRRSIARSANTGISGFINQKGEIIKKSDYWVEESLYGSLISNNKLSFYVVYGDFIGRIFSFIAVLLILYLISAGLIKKKVEKTSV